MQVSARLRLTAECRMSPLDIMEKDGKLISKTGENYLSIKVQCIALHRFEPREREGKQKHTARSGARLESAASAC